uniref:Uncharacterized protein n=1 Tax=Avena sativa TaxID=4498 RepID=A0ACD5UNC9_AVESA
MTVASPLPSLVLLGAPPLFFLFSGNGPRRRRGMSSFDSAFQKSWPRYGEVSMTRCPDCPRLDPLKRLTCVRSARGNVGQEFVKCESKPRQGKDGKDLEECGHFEWMDKYIQDRQLQFQVLPPIQASISSAVEEEISNRGSPNRAIRPLEDFFDGELQKLNKQLSQIVELKKQSNMMAGAFYLCIIAIYLMFLYRLD